MSERALDPLWRGLVGYRLIALAYAGALAVIDLAGYRSAAGALAVLAAMVAWTGLSGVGYLRFASARRLLVALDVVVTLGAVLSVPLVDTAERISHGALLPGVWVSGAVVAVALAFGPLPGVLAALLVQGVVVLVRGYLGPTEITDLLLMVAASVAVGYAAGVLRRSVERLRQATELRAAMVERERLGRDIHDGVLQVLAQVRRRGAELGGAAGELGVLAGEQEVALRTLVTTGPPAAQPLGQLDLAARLSALATASVTVSVPGEPVPLPAHAGNETLAAVRAALDNVRAHVGPDAPAWILLEDLGERVVVSVRDDGPGIPDGRLDEARTQGRMGVARSIRGRIEDVGGAAACVTGAGLGCEWTFDIPRGST
ncbi:MacS family sensor histidine kinase [Pseudonocardia acaciae]|uniref:MacS family sensor histidine kinase n=1 Tax=Pseudonocardia acaciae TaxID=551276 RepID=UPI000490FAF4|nr:DUF5931 domain-containing protein [Pseudonocardia acaciae]